MVSDAATDDVCVYDLNIIIQEPNGSSGNSFDALLKDIESDPDSALGLAKARKWVGKTFKNESPTITSLRLAKGLSQKQLANLMKSSQSYVARLEQGMVDPGTKVIQKVATALGVSNTRVFEAVMRGLSE